MPKIAFSILLALAAFVSSAIIVGLMRRHAYRIGMMDVPNERSLHTTPMPRGGGLAIAVATLVGGWLVYTWLGSKISAVAFLLFTIGAALIAAVSWIDDLHSLPVRLRLGTHLAGALLATFAFGYWRSVQLPVFGLVPLGWLGLPITLLWIVGLTNAYNFMDGIDGLAGGQAVVAGLGWLAVGALTGGAFQGALGLLIAASSSGFLIFNWPPARIFMGDVGSAFLGYTLAVLPLMTADPAPQLPLAAFLLVWPFVVDSGLTFLRRLIKREDVFAAHRAHVYQRLVIAGRSHRFVTLLYLGLAAVGGLVGVAWARVWPGAEIGMLLILCAGLGLWAGVGWVERRAASAAIIAESQVVDSHK